MGEDLPLPPARLFERLAQIPGYTWDQSFEPFHSSYDNWHVYGIRHIPETDSSGPAPSPSVLSSGSNRSSPKLETRPSLRHHWSSISEADSDISSSRGDPEAIWTPVIARISTHVIRLERVSQDGASKEITTANILFFPTGIPREQIHHSDFGP